ncbi:DUF4136 domain-containing protein [Psychromonas sp. B3M02]|uniref:DUF4136 domain-containing protein n=1 Tax=Psychromonas sp. B3M02 TaxID=2267226 RepID=UPI000DE89B3B|nr:DUF4136 domain-containing protein [Psychromonas sp. B3M02]RBW44942.1 DUF4136 domain-containing protein [Psychromonas sp. B3M02]
MKKHLLFLLVAVQLVLAGCTSTPVVKEEPIIEPEPLTLVSSGKPSKVLPSFTTYSWNDDYNFVLAKEEATMLVLTPYIRQQVAKYMSSKGYKLVSNPDQAEMVIGFLFAADDVIANNQVEQRFGLIPGTVREKGADPRYKKGSLILSAMDNRTTKIYWRSAVRGFSDLERDKVTTNGSKMQYILSMLLGDFPEAGR